MEGGEEGRRDCPGKILKAVSDLEGCGPSQPGIVK
jgi:hypothetical protein